MPGRMSRISSISARPSSMVVSGSVMTTSKDCWRKQRIAPALPLARSQWQSTAASACAIERTVSVSLPIRRTLLVAMFVV